MLRGFTRIIRQVRSMASEFSRGMQTMADEAELGDIKGTLEDVKRGNLSGVADAIDPGGDLKDSVEDLKTSARETGLSEARTLANAARAASVLAVSGTIRARISRSKSWYRGRR